MPTFTVKEAATALGCSVRTIRRRIADGELSATLERRGTADVRVLDPAELARWAEASGQTLAIPEGNEGQGGAVVCDTEGQVPSPAPVATEGNDGRQGGNEGQAVVGGAEGKGNGGHVPSPVAVAAGAPGAGNLADVRALREQLQAVTEERDFLRRVLENVTRALPEGTPAAPTAPTEKPAEPDRRSWWRRLWQRE